MRLKLYTTSNCHLCEQAEQLLKSIKEVQDITLIEIAINDDLIELYGTRIPVLQRTDNLAELSWPFNSDEVKAFIKI